MDHTKIDWINWSQNEIYRAIDQYSFKFRAANVREFTWGDIQHLFLAGDIALVKIWGNPGGSRLYLLEGRRITHVEDDVSFPNDPAAYVRKHYEAQRDKAMKDEKVHRNNAAHSAKLAQESLELATDYRIRLMHLGMAESTGAITTISKR